MAVKYARRRQGKRLFRFPGDHFQQQPQLFLKFALAVSHQADAETVRPAATGEVIPGLGGQLFDKTGSFRRRPDGLQPVGRAPGQGYGIKAVRHHQFRQMVSSGLQHVGA